MDQPSQILSYLYIGNKANAKSLKVLQSLGIKYIINCTPKRSDDPENGCPNYYEKDLKYGLQYKRIPIFDNRGENILPHIETVYKFIEESRHYGNILVHCHKGVSRSVAMVIAYLMKKNELTYDEALSHVQMFRSIAQPNDSFEQQLKAFQPNQPNLLQSSLNESPQKQNRVDTIIGPAFPDKKDNIPSAIDEKSNSEKEEDSEQSRKKPRIV